MPNSEPETIVYYTRQQVLGTSLKYFRDEDITGATETFVNKYALRTCDDESWDNYLERTPLDMQVRCAKEFARKEAELYGDKALPAQVFLAAFAKTDFHPWEAANETWDTVLRSAETHSDFGAIVLQGSPLSGIGNVSQIQSLSNCFVVDAPSDSYGGICRTDEQLIQIMKRRGGCGTELMHLRPKGMPTSNAARTTDGLVPYMKRYARTTEEVAQGGRRGALMLSLLGIHPQTEYFINAKRDLTTVNGANVSVKYTDEFMQAVVDDGDFTLQWPCYSDTPRVKRVVKAKHIWRQTVDAAWYSAEPGALFWSTILKRTPAQIYHRQGFGTISTNPCLTGDTMVAVVDERKFVSIKQLADEGEDVLVFAHEISTGNTVIKTMRHPRLTEADALVYKVTMSGGFSFKTTANHKMLSDSNVQKEVKDFSANDKLLFKLTSDTTKLLQLSVLDVQECGHEDVYNGTVDDEHTFYIGGHGGWACDNDTQLMLVSINCGEVPLSAHDSCRLCVIDVRKFVNDMFMPTAWFDYDLYGKYTQFAMRVMDDLVDLEIEAVDRIIAKIESDPEEEEDKRVSRELWLKVKKAAVNGRRTGLGNTAVGDTIAMLNMRYGSDESISLVDSIYKTLALGAYRATVSLARERGTFPVYDHELEKDHEFINQIMDLDPQLRSDWEKYGRRNIALTTTAPVGSISIMLKSTSGIEPVYLTTYKRSRKINPDELEVRVDRVDESGIKWTTYDVVHPGLEQWKKVTGLENIEQSPYYNATSADVDWKKSIHVQAAAQRWICHSISKTVNLPKNASHKLVNDVMIEAWKTGCKGVTVYRDESRIGVLNRAIADEDMNLQNAWFDGLAVADLVEMVEVFESSKESMPAVYASFINDRVKPIITSCEGMTIVRKRKLIDRPRELPCKIYRLSIEGTSYTAIVGIKNNRPYEIFCGKSESIELPRKLTDGLIIKSPKNEEGRSTYDLVIPFDDEKLTIKDIVNVFDNPQYGSLTRSISLHLREGVSIKKIVEQFRKDKHALVTSFSTVIARVLAKYIKNGDTVADGSKCSCGGVLAYFDSCHRCLSCGKSDKCA